MAERSEKTSQKLFFRAFRFATFSHLSEISVDSLLVILPAGVSFTKKNQNHKNCADEINLLFWRLCGTGTDHRIHQRPFDFWGQSLSTSDKPHASG